MTPPELAARPKVLEKVFGGQGRSRKDVGIAVSPADRPCDADTLTQYSELGVSQVVMVCMGNDIASFREQADKLADTFVVTASRQ